MEGTRYRMGCVQPEPGDKLFQYTDGVTEATNRQNELYGMKRLEAVLNRNAGAKPDELLPAVKADIDAFVGGAPQFDDITMLCLEFKEMMNTSDPHELTVEAALENIPAVTAFVEERPIGGLGIFMVKKTMDDVRYEYKDGRNILTVEKRL